MYHLHLIVITRLLFLPIRNNSQHFQQKKKSIYTLPNDIGAHDPQEDRVRSGFRPVDRTNSMIIPKSWLTENCTSHTAKNTLCSKFGPSLNPCPDDSQQKYTSPKTHDLATIPFICASNIFCVNDTAGTENEIFRIEKWVVTTRWDVTTWQKIMPTQMVLLTARCINYTVLILTRSKNHGID